MSRKSLIWIGLALGSFVGSFIPLIWGDSVFSAWSVIFSGLGGIAGIYFGFKLGD
jgi:hypothetical protein